MSERPPQPSNKEQLNLKEDLERNFSERLNSKETIEAIRQFPEEQREGAIGCAIEYLYLFKDSTGLTKYLSELQKIEIPESFRVDSRRARYEKKKAELLVRKAEIEIFGARYDGARDLKKGDREKLEKIYSWFQEHFKENGYLFHSFNGTFEHAIREHGLLTERANVSHDDIDRVREIFGKLAEEGYGPYKDVTGYSKSSNRRIYFTGHTDFIYRYATVSPEWFFLFCIGSHHDGDALSKEMQDKRKAAYCFKDYQAVRKNIESLCDSAESKSGQKLSLEEKEEVLGFFDKYWNIFMKETGPRVALIKRSAIQREADYESPPFYKYSTFKEYVDSYKDSKQSRTIDDAVSWLMLPNDMNSYTRHDISANELLIIDLPEYATIYEAGKPHSG